MNPKNTDWGKFWLLSCLISIEATCLRLFTKFLGLDVDEVRRSCERAQQEVKALTEDTERADGFTYKLRVLVARKPIAPARATAEPEARAHVPPW